MVLARNERARGGVPGRRDGERQQQAEHGPCAAELQAGVVKQEGKKLCSESGLETSNRLACGAGARVMVLTVLFVSAGC